MDSILKGRGAQINPSNRFHDHIYDDDPRRTLDEGEEQIRTQYIKVHPKTILNKVTSPDIPLGFSMNPYQGCEHGCVYCYARNTHNYWGYSAGVEFEQKILVKEKAPELLEQKLKSKQWKAVPILFSGNTDCYQPIEKEKKITRKMLEILWRYRHPVGIITKNSLVLRDLDLLKQLSAHGLVRVALSITTFDDKLRQFLEPRTASVASRLKTLEQLAAAGIPTTVMIAPIIPGLTEHELLPIAAKAAELGASSIGYTMIRLNGDVAIIFEDWLRKVYPDRADKILHKIKECHEGSLEDKKLGRRMRGAGNIAEVINQQFKLAKRKYFNDRSLPPYNVDLHQHFKTPQMKLFL